MGPLKHHLRSEGPLERALEVGFFSGQFFLFPFLFTFIQKLMGFWDYQKLLFFDRQVFLIFVQKKHSVSV